MAGAADQQIGAAGQGQQGQRLQGGANINLRHPISLISQQLPTPLIPLPKDQDTHEMDISFPFQDKYLSS